MVRIVKIRNPPNVNNPDILIFLPHRLRVNNKNTNAGNSINPDKLNTRN